MVKPVLEENIMVAMRDGIRLAVDVHRPRTTGKVPALLSMSPYGKERQRQPGGFIENKGQPYRGGIFRQVEAGDTGYFVSKGYAHVIADSRGSAPSEGQWGLMDQEEQQDGYELVEWIARQPWSNGNVGMVGESYYAQIQYLVAATRPPHLKTIVPFDGWTDIYRDLVHQGGLFHQGFFASWISIVCERILPELGKKAPRKWRPAQNIIGDTVTSNPTDGPYYWERSSYTKFDRIKIPTYHIISPTHYLHYRGQLNAYTDIDTPKKLLVTGGMPWGVTYHPAFSKEVVRWLDYWLKGIDNGIMKEPPVTLFIQGSDEWRCELEYPLKRTGWTKLYLHSGEKGGGQAPYGQLTKKAPAVEKPDSYDYPHTDGLVDANLPVVAYLTPPLEENMEIIGPASLTLYASSSANDTAWIVKIDDVAPDGKFKVAGKGWLKASHREVDEARSRMGQPFHTHMNPTPLRPKEVYKFEIEIWPIFRSFKAGHRLRLRIASKDSRMWDIPNWHAVVEQVAHNTIYH
ncbi:MAG: PepX protein, partial [Dehalococcoidia bacterium]|nr:PepX protein [Dehalococcoidia bacterium]